MHNTAEMNKYLLEEGLKIKHQVEENADKMREEADKAGATTKRKRKTQTNK